MIKIFAKETELSFGEFKKFLIKNILETKSLFELFFVGGSITIIRV